MHKKKRKRKEKKKEEEEEITDVKSTCEVPEKRDVMVKEHATKSEFFFFRKEEGKV